MIAEEEGTIPDIPSCVATSQQKLLEKQPDTMEAMHRNPAFHSQITNEPAPR